MFFEIDKKLDGDPVRLCNNITVEGEGYARDVALECAERFGAEDGTVKSIRFVPGEGESYSIDVRDCEIVVSGHVIYGAVTLLQLCEFGELCEGKLEDSPDCEFRGYRVYLPGRKFFSDFKNMVDTLAYYKYNYLSVEIGGAMEYKRHPEINEAWRAFAEETHKYSDRTLEIQKGFPWAKDSIHTENGDGDILTQDEVRELIEYARYRGLKVYPEAPTMSHTDYICLAHPEIREREEDPYPDTYCPNHPDTYKIVFDILDEIIDVFQPEVINIGHDELYSVGLCPRCRDKHPDELYAQDITKIHDYLAERGIKTMMWGEKLLPVVLTRGRTYGGAGSRRPNKEYPPLFLCQYMIPNDVIMLHWYHSFGEQYDFVYHTHGFPVVYGNLSLDRFEAWRRRKSRGKVLGGSFSNWGSNETEYMQRNCQFMRIIFGAYAFWSKTYDTPDNERVLYLTYEEAYRRHFGDGHAVVFEHNTDVFMPYEPFYCGKFIDEKACRLGDYKVTHSDGSVELFPVKYGTNISNEDMPVTLKEFAEKYGRSSTDEVALGEICYSVIPLRKNGKTYFRTQFEDKRPDTEIASVEFIPARDCKVDFTWYRK